MLLPLVVRDGTDTERFERFAGRRADGDNKVDADDDIVTGDDDDDPDGDRCIESLLLLLLLQLLVEA